MNKTDLLKKVETIFNKIIYILEFPISVLLLVEVFKVITTKQYEGYFPLKNTIFTAILSIMLIGIITYVCIKHKDKVERLFVAFAMPLAIAFAIFILPLNVPDEGSHIMRAYDISLGNIFTKIDSEGNSSTNIIKELNNYSHSRVGNYSNVRDEVSKQTNYDEESKEICAAQAYSPLLYVGTAFGMLITRIFNINIFYGIYLARLCNIIIFLLFGYFSIKKIPIGKIALAVFLCMPMMLHQAASCSADAVLNAALVYYISNLVYVLLKEEKLTLKDRIIIYISTALIAMFKYVYIIVAGILFIGIFKKEKRKEFIKLSIITVLVGSVFSIGWLVFTSKYTSSPDVFVEYYKTANVSVNDQIEYIKENPKTFIQILLNEHKEYGNQYIEESIGSRLGWLAIAVNPLVILAYMLIMIIAAMSEKNNTQLSKLTKVWTVILFFIISILINIAMYTTWTPVGTDRVNGIQGRYYTPIIILIILCFIKKDTNWEVKNLNIKMLITSFMLNVITINQVIEGYL